MKRPELARAVGGGMPVEVAGEDRQGGRRGDLHDRAAEAGVVPHPQRRIFGGTKSAPEKPVGIEAVGLWEDGRFPMALADTHAHQPAGRNPVLADPDRPLGGADDILALLEAERLGDDPTREVVAPIGADGGLQTLPPVRMIGQHLQAPGQQVRHVASAGLYQVDEIADQGRIGECLRLIVGEMIERADGCRSCCAAPTGFLGGAVGQRREFCHGGFDPARPGAGQGRDLDQWVELAHPWGARIVGADPKEQADHHLVGEVAQMRRR